jgi:hypothetical protein
MDLPEMSFFASIFTRGRLSWAAVLLAPPLLLGALYLVSTKQPVLPGLRGCQYISASAAQLDCYSERIAAMAKADGVEAAIAAVEERAVGNTALSNQCHLAFHPIGERDGAAAAKAGDVFPDFANESACSDGYSHGFYIGYLSDLPASELAADVVSRHCSENDASSAVISCTHSFGHVLARKKPVDEAAMAQTCDSLTFPGHAGDRKLPAAARFDCKYGAYMEYSLAGKGSTVPAINHCGSAPASALKACISYLAPAVARLTDDPTESAKVCEAAAATDELKQVCGATVGAMVGNGDSCSGFHAAIAESACRAAVERS